MARMRTVVESAEVSEKIDAESTVYPRLEEAFDALKWWLSHVPESGELLDDCHWIYRQRGNSKTKTPALVALYLFDDNEVEISSVLIRAIAP